ncbi:MAG: hypothetical protein IJ188_09900 [Clostridia bacterium]|nr:hypothetical protein [Clostridia bacterium]
MLAMIPMGSVMKRRRCTVKIALAQMQISSDREENYRKTLEFIRRAAENGAELVCFPEIQLSPFFPQYPGRDANEYAMRLEDEHARGICEACRENRMTEKPWRWGATRKSCCWRRLIFPAHRKGAASGLIQHFAEPNCMSEGSAVWY